MFYHFCQVEAFNFVRCDKISNFCSIRRTFFKKALAFSSEKCYLVSNKSGSRIQRLRRALHLPALGFILLIIMLFSSFTFLSFTLSRKGRKKRLPNLHGEALFSVLRFLFKDRPYSIQPLRQCEALTERFLPFIKKSRATRVRLSVLQILERSYCLTLHFLPLLPTRSKRTVPSTRANRVSSLPLPTFSPG